MSVQVLLVEDNPYDRELVFHALQGFPTVEGPLEITAANLWATGREKMRAKGFDVVVLDYYLPGMDGLEILNELIGTAHPPVVMLTAQQDRHRALQMLSQGAVEYVSKLGKNWCGDIRSAVVRTVLARQPLGN